MARQREEKRKKRHPLLKFLSFIFILALGVACGCCVGVYLTRNDVFELIGEKTIEIKVGEQYEDEGVKVIAFGKEVSKDKIKVESNVDSSTAGEYQIVYTVSNLRYWDTQRVRDVKVVANSSGDTGNGNEQGGGEDTGNTGNENQGGENTGNENQGGGNQGETPDVEVVEGNDIKIHFLELGKNTEDGFKGSKNTGDCVFIQCGDNDILIDAGSAYASSTVIIDYLDKYITDNTLEYVIATHAHEDHISAFSSTKTREGVFAHYKTETIIDFPLTNSTTKVYSNYVAARDAEVEEGAKHYTALECYNNQNGAKRVYALTKTIELEILYNYYYENKTSNENNYSVCVMINHGGNHYLFTGDLEEEGEDMLVDYYEEHHGGLPHCSLFKAGHHGSGTANGSKLLETITPDIVCICCCAGTSEYTEVNDNQFPYQEVINRVAKYTDKVYVTSVVDMEDAKRKNIVSMNGDIVVSSNGEDITVKGSNNDTLLKDTEWFKERRTCPDEWKEVA